MAVSAFAVAKHGLDIASAIKNGDALDRAAAVVSPIPFIGIAVGLVAFVRNVIPSGTLKYAFMSRKHTGQFRTRADGTRELEFCQLDWKSGSVEIDKATGKALTFWEPEEGWRPYLVRRPTGPNLQQNPKRPRGELEVMSPGYSFHKSGRILYQGKRLTVQTAANPRAKFLGKSVITQAEYDELRKPTDALLNWFQPLSSMPDGPIKRSILAGNIVSDEGRSEQVRRGLYGNTSTVRVETIQTPLGPALIYGSGTNRGGSPRRADSFALAEGSYSSRVRWVDGYAIAGKGNWQYFSFERERAILRQLIDQAELLADPKRKADELLKRQQALQNLTRKYAATAADKAVAAFVASEDIDKSAADAIAGTTIEPADVAAIEALSNEDGNRILTMAVKAGAELFAEQARIEIAKLRDAQKAEAERIEAERRKKAEAERIAAEARAEAERIAAEARAEAERKLAEAERIAAEARAEAERKLAEAERKKAEARAEAERKRAEASEQARLSELAQQNAARARAEQNLALAETFTAQASEAQAAAKALISEAKTVEQSAGIAGVSLSIVALIAVPIIALFVWLSHAEKT